MRSSALRFWLMLAIAICLLSAASTAAHAQQIPASAKLQPSQLAAMLQAPHPPHASPAPLVLQVGSHTLYQEAHIPGAIYAGPAGTPEGLHLLRQAVVGLQKDARIVIYCGCCPWTRCPNIRPAYKELKQLGFAHIQALYLAHNFGTDWIQAGYPVTHGDIK